jgi:rhodanese-related sulfurtransferase
MLERRKQNTIDVVEALAGLRAGRLVLVDVREADERARAYVPGSQHLPMAATAARRAGVDAHNVQGGMNAWERENLDTERSAS